MLAFWVLVMFLLTINQDHLIAHVTCSDHDGQSLYIGMINHHFNYLLFCV